MDVPSDADNLASAIANAVSYWLEQFNTGLKNLINAQRDVAAQTASTTEKTKQQNASAVSAAQGQMQSALQQLAQVDTMECERQGRAAFDALALLASDVGTRLRDVTRVASSLPNPLTGFDAVTLDHVNLYLRILDQLARVAPTTIWRPSSS